MAFYKVDPVKVAELMLQTNCTAASATAALKIRKGIMIFALEYLDRRDLSGVMDIKERYPRWNQYLEQKKRV